MALAIGGIRLIGLHGSWYYAIAGAGLIVSGVLLMLKRVTGAWAHGAVLLGTLVWTVWEVGLDFWGFVPRIALLLLVGIFVALLLPRLDGAPTHTASRRVAALLGLAFVLGIGWAFAPHHVYRSGAEIGAGNTPASPHTGGEFVQPADAPASADWTAYGRSNAATRYSPLQQITRENVQRLQRAWTYRTGDMPIEGTRKWGADDAAEGGR